MEGREHQDRKVAEVAKEIGAVLRRQARKRWETVRTADRNEGNRHVWRFQAGPGHAERFLHVTHEAMLEADAAPTLIAQLKTGRLFERLHRGPETSLLLSRSGRLEAYPVN
ncbi:MAG: hypothetical protein ACJ8GN_06555 [Longimicrobiaceae bacterium]